MFEVIIGLGFGGAWGVAAEAVKDRREEERERERESERVSQDDPFGGGREKHQFRLFRNM